MQINVKLLIFGIVVMLATTNLFLGFNNNKLNVSMSGDESVAVAEVWGDFAPFMVLKLSGNCYACSDSGEGCWISSQCCKSWGNCP